MKKKDKDPQPEEVDIIDEQILRNAKLIPEDDAARIPVKACEICGSDAAPTSTENLCWVCRRLKISAWRDSEAQVPAQE